MNVGCLRVEALTAAVDDETTGAPIKVLGWPWLAVYVTGTGTTSSGVITIETADFDPSTASTYTGTWSAITTVNASDVTGGAQKYVALTVAAYTQIRARVSTAIGGGGSVSVVVVGA